MPADTGRANEDVVARPRFNGRQRSLALAGFVGFTVLIYAFQSFVDDGRPLQTDFSPGLQVDADPYQAPAGCPARSWNVGEFMPAACIAPYRMDRPQLAIAALEAPRRLNQRVRHPSYRTRMWVRAGDDAILIARPGDAAGQVLKVVRDRFASPKILATDAHDAKAETYTDPPFSYLLSAVRYLTLPLLLIAPVFGLLFMAAKRWPSLAEDPPRWSWRDPPSDL